MMTTTFYRGEFFQFDFNKYIDIHLQAHQYYEQAEPGALTESMKILHFKGGIQSEAGMETSIESACGSPMLTQALQLFLTTFLKDWTVRKAEPVPRKVEHGTFQQPHQMTLTSIQDKNVVAEEGFVVVAEEDAAGEDREGVKAVATAWTVWDQL